MCRSILPLIIACTLLGTTAAQEEPPLAAEDVAAALQVVRDDLIQLQLEKALAELDLLMARTDLSRMDRAEAWILRARAHVAFGDLDAAEKDYREVLNLRPAFRPEESLITPKAAERFNRVRAAMIGTLRLDIQPDGTTLSVDDREKIPSAEGTVAVLAGSRRIRIEKKGYEPVEEILEVPAGVELRLERQLYPNARDVLVRSWLPDVRVFLDGVEVGKTSRSTGTMEGVAGSQDPVLVLADVPLGEHSFEFSLDCHHSSKIVRMVTVDVMDPAPLTLPRVELEPARVDLRLEGDLPAARIRIDGEPTGGSLNGSLPVCPGRRVLEVTASDRLVYRKVLEVEEGRPLQERIVPRPNVLLVGTDTWPTALDRLSGHYSLLSPEPSPMDGDPADPSTWNHSDLPPEADLVLAVFPGEFSGAEGEMVLYSPQLGEALPLTPQELDRFLQPPPSWIRWAPGISVADDARAGLVRVVQVLPGSPAENAGIVPGAAVLSVGGEEVKTVDQYRKRLDRAEKHQPLAIRCEAAPGRSGEPISLELPGADSPWLASPAVRGEIPGRLVAWSQVAAAAYPALESSALANLALAYAETGRFEAAVETWKRVRWAARRGIGEGTRAYYLGIALDRLNREDEAARAFRKAASSGATAFDDDGPAVGPAAMDHLADLGVILDQAGD